jgi:hypothetical protein
MSRDPERGEKPLWMDRRRSMHFTRFIATAAACAVILGGALPGGSRAGSPAQLAVVAQHVSRAPQGIDDPLWNGVPAVLIPVKGRDGPDTEQATVTTKALYTDDSLFFLYRWLDPTRSVVKRSWTFDGVKWVHLPGDEDRIAVLFEITRINHFAARGCAVTCHSPPDVPKENWKLATQTAAERGDLWHWKAARSDPYGYADDSWLTVAGRPTGSYRETGRVADAGDGGDVGNQTEDGSRPRYMRDPIRKGSAPGLLLYEEAIEITDYSLFRAGDVIPYRLPRRPSGSRFDVKAVSRYDDGAWSVMLYRKLNTGHDDDVIFDPRKSYSFAMAVFDDSGADHSKATQPLVLKFSR